MLTSEQREALKELVSLVSNMHPTKWAVACSAINGILAASAAPAEGRECCNENCGWRGPADETVQMKHGYPNNLCPKCHEVTEVATAPTMSEAERPTHCTWTYEDDNETVVWQTACGETFVFCNDDGPLGNSMKWCCYCGGKMTERIDRAAAKGGSE